MSSQGRIHQRRKVDGTSGADTSAKKVDRTSGVDTSVEKV